jgi:hypothetical protein
MNFGSIKVLLGAKEVIGLIIGFLLVAILFPIAMSQVTAATTSNWNSAVAVVFAVLLPILVIIGVATRYF